MLLGQSRNNLDSKGRIFVPVKWRPDTSDHVVVLIGLNPADVKKEERFLQILRYEKFVEFAKDLTSSRPSDLSLMRAKRKIFSSAEECTLDKQGRILIPQWLAKYANLKDEVLGIPMISRQRKPTTRLMSFAPMFRIIPIKLPVILLRHRSYHPHSEVNKRCSMI